MDITVIGGGFVGVTTAVVFAEQGHGVSLVEASRARREALQAGRLPFYEEGLEEAFTAVLARGLRILGSVAEAPPSELVYLCVGTPSLPDGGADLSQLTGAAREVAAAAPAWPGRPTVVVKSTVPPGTTRDVVSPVLVAHGLGPAAMNPEFLREGCALKDARTPDRVVCGVASEAARAALETLYINASCPVVFTDSTTAETVKYTANAMLATRVAFSNEVGNLCERLGVNVDEVMASVGLDFRIGPHFLKAGVGYGGSCFPKDIKALRATGAAHGVPLPILDAVLSNNDSQPLRAVAMLREALGGLAGKRVALLGLAFKPGTSDVRETRALPIYQALVEEGADVVCHDPHAGKEFQELVGAPVQIAPSAEAALLGADGCVLHTEWPEYRDVSPSAFAGITVVDGRRHLDGAALQRAGAHYLAVGDGTRLRQEVEA